METNQNEQNREEKSNKFYNIYLFGVIACIISFTIFCLGDKYEGADSEGWFFINYGIFILLLITSITRGFMKSFGFFNPSKYKMTFPILIAGLISCFALNKSVNIFHSSTEWLQILLILTSISILLLPYQEKLNKISQYILSILIGLSIILHIYYSIILIPVYPISIIGMIVIGIGIHTFIPLLLLINLCIFYFKRAEKTNRQITFLSIIVGLLFLGFSTLSWNVRSNKINSYLMEQSLRAPSDFQEWIGIAQHIPADNLTKKVILSDLLYARSDDFFGEWDFFSIGNNNNLNTTLTHDPLVIISSIFSPPITLDRKDKIKFLESIFDARHLTENRLWTGKDLTTSSVVTNIRIYPSQHLAYTEKTLTIHNKNKGWRNQQEAIYTFYLPEAATVTSLSLWINGIEEKAILTTKAKAEKAYNTIVGVEKRDPSVIHWQEGNKVSVRIFPCTNDEDRRVKIGITSPLQQTQNNYSVYNNITFKGPSAKGSKELIQVQYMDDVQELRQSKRLKFTGNNIYKANRNYNESIDIKFLSHSIKTMPFSFNNKTYNIYKHENKFSKFEADDIYLDINKSWTKQEFSYIIDNIKNKKIYVYIDNIQEITQTNKDNIFKILSKNNFSLFPIYLIKNPEKSILITKNNEQSPNLNEIKTSVFYDKLTAFLQKEQTINVFSLGDELSPYLKTLKEYRAILVDKKSVESTVKSITNNIFIKNIEDQETVFIDNAKIIIKENETTENNISKAPNHLFRLFAYNTILKEMKTKFITNDTLIDENAIQLASMANIVSPVSSLIVLETQEDYERFDIKKNKDALGNADMHNEGAVPEPHEWALIIITLITLSYLHIKRKYATTI